MSQVSDFVAKENAFMDRMDTAIAGLQGDIDTLNSLIAQLQASAGQITPEDQALLDQLETRGAAAADKLEALDNLTPAPVVVPVPEPTPEPPVDVPVDPTA